MSPTEPRRCFRGCSWRPVDRKEDGRRAAHLSAVAGAGDPSVVTSRLRRFSLRRAAACSPDPPRSAELIRGGRCSRTVGRSDDLGTVCARPAEAPEQLRDAIAAFLYRFADQPAYTMPKGSCFTDVSRSQLFAKEMCWMKSEGISQGWADGTYRPLEPVKRDAMAAFLQRYDAKF